MADPKIVFPFSLTADEVNALDGTAVTIASFSDDDSPLIRVPVRIEISKDAGTAYAVTYNLPGQDSYDDLLGGVDRRKVEEGPNNNPPFTRRSHDYVGQTIAAASGEAEGRRGAKAYLLVRDENSRILFRIPADTLLQTAAFNSVVVFPDFNGAAFRKGRNTFSIISNVAIASGTGSVAGRIFFEEYPAPSVV
jgi:hypothetical protein